MIIISEDFPSTQKKRGKRGVKSTNREKHPSGNDNNFGRFSLYDDEEEKEKGFKCKNKKKHPSGNFNNFGRFSPYADDEVKGQGTHFENEASFRKF